MKTLKEKLIEEAKLVGRTFIPLNAFNDNFHKDTKSKWVYYGLGKIFLSVGEVLFLGFSLKYKTPDFTEWNGIQEQRDKQEIVLQDQKMKDLFYKTAGKDSVIDYKEFEKFYKENYSPQ